MPPYRPLAIHACRTSRFLSILLLFLFFFKKEITAMGGAHNTGPRPVGAMPEIFAARELIDYFSGEWNPLCLIDYASLRARQCLDSKQGVALSVLQENTRALTSFFNCLSRQSGGAGGFPWATLNQFPAPSGTQTDSPVISIINSRSNLFPMLSATSDLPRRARDTCTCEGTLRRMVHAGLADSLPGLVWLMVYVIEANRATVDQVRAGPGYFHQRMLRQVLTASLGDTHTLPKGEPVMREYLGLPGNLAAIKDHCRIIAGLHTCNRDSKQLKVLHVRDAKLQGTKMWA